MQPVEHLPAAASDKVELAGAAPAPPAGRCDGAGRVFATGDSNVDELDLDPLITGLLRRLPPIEKTWPARERVRRLQALNVNLGIIYGPSEIEEIKVILNDPDS